MWVKIALFLSVFAILFFFIGTVFAYYLLKYVFTELRTDHFDTYSYETDAILNRYKDTTIVRAHIVQRQIPRRWLVGLYIMRLFLSDDLRRNTLDVDLFHQGILLEVATDEGPRFLLLEKTCELVLRDTVRLTRAHTLRPLSLSSEDHTVGSLLASTRNTMGDERFFNWRTDNTCQSLVAELATHLDKQNQVDLLNELDALSKEDAYLLNNMLYYYYKVMRMLRVDRHILKYVT